MSANISKLLLGTIGRILPLRRHPGGGIGNRIRCALVKKIIKEMGNGCVIEPGAEIYEGCIFGDRVGIGPNCMIGPRTTFKGYTMMGPNVHIYTENHVYDDIAHNFNGTVIKPVVIGEEVWIGYGTIILPGVEVGSHTIIGAGSVVTKNVPSGVLAAGNPCQVRKIIDPFYYAKIEKEKQI